MFFLHRIRRARAHRGRNIFPFKDGVRRRYVDPCVIDRMIEKELPDLDTVLKFLVVPTLPGGKPLPDVLHKQAVAKQKLSIAKLVDTVIKVLGVHRWDETTRTGLTEDEVLDIIFDFMAFTGRLATAAGPLSNSPGPQGECPSPSTPTADAPTMPCSPGSTSGGTGSSESKRESSPTL